ncbi:hypothetical protein [Pseudomonas coronafaciens]|uniref:hypothetical protein n=1 Tax=Pseudomonas coronafaciens TaxID=53409 RepID=UPI001424AE93|nr:hypothetical protein [Pseudomonas coronafaciens]QIQ72008.1 hypothetical protein HBB04_02399 [Pseudomonas coronafaciens]
MERDFRLDFIGHNRRNDEGLGHIGNRYIINSKVMRESRHERQTVAFGDSVDIDGQKFAACVEVRPYKHFEFAGGARLRVRVLVLLRRINELWVILVRAHIHDHTSLRMQNHGTNNDGDLRRKTA